MINQTVSGLLTPAYPAAGPLSLLPFNLDVLGWLLGAQNGRSQISERTFAASPGQLKAAVFYANRIVFAFASVLRSGYCPSVFRKPASEDVRLC